MIHYTLLPEQEIKALRREYRFRFIITLLFFVSCAVILGIGALTPAFIFSYSQEREALEKVKVLQKSREESGLQDIMHDLTRTDLYIKKLQGAPVSNRYSPVIIQIIDHKNSNIKIHSFKFIPVSVDIASSSTDLFIEGKAMTREALINFKEKLEGDASISNVDLPVSDLAKSRDISFSLKLSVTLPK